MLYNQRSMWAALGVFLALFWTGEAFADRPGRCGRGEDHERVRDGVRQGIFAPLTLIREQVLSHAKTGRMLDVFIECNSQNFIVVWQRDDKILHYIVEAKTGRILAVREPRTPQRPYGQRREGEDRDTGAAVDGSGTD